MSRKRRRPKRNDNGAWWSAVKTLFIRLPVFELAFVTIIIFVIRNLPEILRNINKENASVGTMVCVGLLILTVLCVIGIFSRRRYYDLILPREPKERLEYNSWVLRQNKIDREARYEIRKAIKGGLR